jgi:uncharacterized repeat protein (TIGR03803 family)
MKGKGKVFAFVTFALGVLVFLQAPPLQAQTYTVLHNFSGSDGVYPWAGLISDASGNLYGTTEGGGPVGYGTVFELAYSNGTYTENVLYSFAGPYTGGAGADGASPYAGLIRDASGNLYGTTYGGGTYGNGTVFELVKSSGTYTEHALYSFGASNTDGEHPWAGLTRDALGNLYGTTYEGGASGFGTVFELALTPQAAIQNIVNQVNALDAQGALTAGQDGSLVKQLQHAIKMIDAGKINGAIGNLESFITEVNDLYNSGVLTESQYNDLFTAANSVVTQLQQ